MLSKTGGLSMFESCSSVSSCSCMARQRSHLDDFAIPDLEPIAATWWKRVAFLPLGHRGGFSVRRR